MTMGNVGDVLFDDRAVVELFRDVMSRSADDLDAPLARLLIRVRTDERGEKGMMDINDSIWKASDKPARQDLHVPGKDNQISVVSEQLEDLRLGTLLTFGRDGNVMKGHAKPLDRFLKRIVV